jgi:hypothetical protein
MLNSTEETVTIPKSEYDELVADSRFLNALCRAGVDNWVGYEYAIEDMENEE